MSKNRKVNKPLWTAILVLLVSIVVIIYASKILYDRTVNLLADNLRERILSISITAAAHINPKDLETLQTKEDWKKPQWAKVVNVLHKTKYDNKDVVFMYIFRKTRNDPTKMEFVADADSINPYAQIDVNRDGKVEVNGPDKLQWPGQPYPEADEIPEVLKAYDGPIATQIYTDEYGTVITGYAPIKDENGNTIAILATDIKANDFFVITTQALRPFVIFIVFLTLVISVLMMIIIYVWRSYSRSLERLNSERAEFVSIATHHIAAPLTVLKGYVSMITENNIEPGVIHVIEQSTEKLIRVIRDFVEAYKIDEEKMLCKLYNVDLIALLNKVVIEFEPIFIKKGIAFIYSLPDESFVLALDEEKCMQVIRTLLNNSLRFVKTGNVEIEATIHGKNIEIRILDRGVRNLPKVSERLLLKFSKSGNQIEADIINKDLALYTAKKIIEAHGGHLFIDQEVDEFANAPVTIFLLKLSS